MTPAVMKILNIIVSDTGVKSLYFLLLYNIKNNIKLNTKELMEYPIYNSNIILQLKGNKKC